MIASPCTPHAVVVHRRKSLWRQRIDVNLIEFDCGGHPFEKSSDIIRRQCLDHCCLFSLSLRFEIASRMGPLASILPAWKVFARMTGFKRRREANGVSFPTAGFSPSLFSVRREHLTASAFDRSRCSRSGWKELKASNRGTLRTVPPPRRRWRDQSNHLAPRLGAMGDAQPGGLQRPQMASFR